MASLQYFSLVDISLHCYFTVDIYFTFYNVFIFCTIYASGLSRNIMVLSMSCDCTNTIVSHPNIIIFLTFWLYFMFFLTDVFQFSMLNYPY
jgi:hypothetical protein